MAPFFLPKSTKILQKSDPKRHSKIDRFLHRFLEGPRRPKSAQDGDPSAKTAPRSSPRRPQEGPKKRIAIVSFRVWPPRALQTPSGPSPDPLRNTIFGLLISNTPAKLHSGGDKPMQYPPKSGATPPSAKCPPPLLVCQSLVLTLSLSLSCLVLPCLVLSWLDFPSQLTSKNPPKSIKNRCQDAFPS